MKKILVLLLIGGLVMTTLTGCKDVIFGKSKDEIEDLFVDFMSVFQSENYDFLYEKEGDTENLPEGDKGCWVLSTYMHGYEGKEKYFKGIQLVFNKNTNQCRGYFWLNDDKYVISYKNGEIILLDEKIDVSIKDEFDKFTLLFDVISVDKPYLNSLECERHYYNFEVPLYGAHYIIDADDTNRVALKDNYSNFLYHDVKEVYFEFEGDGGNEWDTTNSRSLRVYYPSKSGSGSITGRMRFSNTESFSEFFEEE